MIKKLFQNLLASHDIVAQRDYVPKLSEIPIEVDEDEETIKIVQLVKSSDPTGQHKSSEPIVVSLTASRLRKKSF